MKALGLSICAVAAGLALVGPARASLAQERQLAQRYAPVVRLVAGGEGCGGLHYVPIDVDDLFGQPTVALRGPWGNDLVQIAPQAKDLGRGLYGYHLDFPGNALRPGCDYLNWQQHLGAEKTPTAYAHVATDPAHPGQLSLQYWFFYVFNDWNNLHEGDWEMIQLVFDAPTVEAALQQSPVEVGYSQHEGAERAAWNDPKLERVDGTHPVVHPADGSHANFYGEALYLGSSASEGVGCDDTRGPTVDVRPNVVTIPSDVKAADSSYPWIAFEGRWGELHPAFFNGPEGPNLKEQWTQPITWAEGWRSRSYAVPGSTVFGPGATGFFCGAVAHASRSLVRLVANPLVFSLVVAGLVLVAIFLLSRTAWRPTAPLRLGRRRAWGQILSASGRMYAARWRLFVGLGLLFIPIGLLITLLQALVLHATNVLAVQAGAGSSGFVGFVALALGTTFTLLGLGLVQAATAGALIELDAGRAVGPLGAYRVALARAGRLFKASADRRSRRLAARELDLPPAGRDLARRPLGADRPGGRARGPRRPRRAAPQPSPRQRALAEGRVARRRRRRARARARPAGRRVADPRHEHAVLARERGRRRDLRGDDAVRRADDRLRLLRLPRPGRARRGGDRRPAAGRDRAGPLVTSAG